MKPDLYKEAHKIWKRLSTGDSDRDFQADLDRYRKMLNFFMTGDYYYYVFNARNGVFDFVSQEIKAVLGYEPAEVNVPDLINNIHPEDQPWFLNFENKVTEFFSQLTPEQVFNYKVRYDFRVRKRNGDYIRVLQQVVTIQSDENNPVLRTFGVHTDITHLKQQGTPVLSFIGLNGEQSYLDVQAEKIFSTNASGLTKRENDILYLLSQGKSSEEISNAFFISRQTVNTHRKNMLRKTGCINATELIALAIRRGWI